METGHASRTAVLVTKGRALAHGDPSRGRFADPVAAALLTPEERAEVERARADAPPASFRARIEYEVLQANAAVMAPRTLAIDDAILERRHAQLVLLGAGLDGRAYRMKALDATTVFEVDHPDSQRDKRARAGALATVVRAQRFVPVDFARDELGAALERAGHDASVPSTWVWEGVVPYLTRGQIESTLAVVRRRSAPGSTLVVGYLVGSVVTRVARAFAGVMFARVLRREDPFEHEPLRSFFDPASMRALLARCGFTVARDEGLLETAAREHIAITRARRSVAGGRIVVAHTGR